MKRTGAVWGCLALALVLCPRAEAASVAAASVLTEKTCPETVDFEAEGYTIRTARANAPFSFLGWIRANVAAASQSVAKLQGKPYRLADILQARDELERSSFVAENVEERFGVLVSVVSLSNCADRQVDVLISVFSSQIAPVLSGTFESRQVEKVAPERTAGADQRTGGLRIEPRVTYDRAEHLSGGGRLEYRAPAIGSALVQSIVVEGRASAEAHELSASMAGARDSADNTIAHADWQLDYLSSSEPTVQSRLRHDRLAGRLSGMTRPLGTWQLPVRFGGLIEGGTYGSDFHGLALPANTVDRADYMSTKLFVGTTTRLDRNVLSASYGVELGSAGPAARVDWIKHIGDFAHELTLPVGDHRALTIESRLTAGFLQVNGTIPAGVRFFGGNLEVPFIPGDAWQIRSNPVIRSIGANLFARTAEGAGGSRFIAYNLTAAVPVWRVPLVPLEVADEASSMANGQINSATSVLELEYAAQDAHYGAVVAKLDDARSALEALKAAVDGAQAIRPGQSDELFKSCERAIARATTRIGEATGSKGSTQLSSVEALLSVDEDRLKKVQDACVEDLNGRVAAPSIAQAGTTLDQIHKSMEREYALIDRTAAARKAKAELAYVRRTVTTLIKEVNVVSVSPVFMFDVAHLSPASSQLGTRYGVGGGLRVTLVDSVDFTAGYLANPRRLPGEGAGAFFMSLQFKDILK